MPELTRIKLGDGKYIFIESVEDVSVPTTKLDEIVQEEALVSKGFAETAVQKLNDIEETIRTYTINTLNAFREIATANIDKVTLEFGIKVAGEGGIPYITKGSAESNLKVMVECSFQGKET